jgi:hypothetical protein
MAYRYVKARYDYGVRKGTRAIVLHMTEGNGTESDVDYLKRDPARGVSANFVILATGEIVRMLPWDHAAGSINPNDLRTSDDPIFTDPSGWKVRYGATAAKAALGDLWHDPNAAVIAVEIGGKHTDGPNAKQRGAIASLVAHARKRYSVRLPVLAHRDFQDYKPCPGHKVSYAPMLGHGVPNKVVLKVDNNVAFSGFVATDDNVALVLTVDGIKIAGTGI